MQQHLFSRQMEWPAGAFLEPWLTFSLPSNMQELSGLRTEQRESLEPWISIEGHPPQSSVVKFHPWKTSAMQLYSVAPCSTGSPLTGSQVSPAPFWEAPKVQAEHKALVLVRKKKQGYSWLRQKKISKSTPEMRVSSRKAESCLEKATTEIQGCHGHRGLVTRQDQHKKALHK